MRVTAGILVAALALSSCGGGSGSNPLGSLASGGSGGSGSGGSGGSGSLGSGGSSGSGGGDQSNADGQPARVAVARDDSILMSSFEAAVVEPARRGAILRVTAFAPTQGYYNARLSGRNGGEPDAQGVLTYELRAIPPTNLQPTGNPGTRQLVVAAFLPDDLRARTRVIRVLSTTKAVELRP